MFLPLLVNLLEAPRRIHQISQVLEQGPQQGLQPELLEQNFIIMLKLI